MLCKSLIGGLCMTILLSAASDTRLADAAQQSDRNGVRSLLKQKADVNVGQGDGMTALHWAAFNDDLEMARMLLGAGANVKAETRLGAVTPLFMACKNGSASMIEALLKAGANANLPDARGTTPLMMAAASGGAEAVKVLLDHGANVNARESAHRQTALMFAAALNRDAAIKVLLEHGADAKLTTKLVDPGCGSVFDVNACLEVDDDGNPVDEEGNPIPKGKESGAGKSAAKETSANPTGQSSSVLGAQVAELQALVKTLVARVDEMEKRSAGAKAPPAAAGSAAAKTENASATPKVEAKAAPRRKGPAFMGGMTALLFAARDGQKDAARALLDAGADVNEVGAGDKMSPLVMAISNGHYDLARYLLDHGADPNLASDIGLTALYATVDMQWAPYAWLPQPITAQEKITYLDLMKALLDRGANPNARLKQKVWFRTLAGDNSWVDPAGATAFWRAAQSDDVAAMRFLVAHGADPKIPTTAGVTPLMVAAGLGWAPNFSRNAPDSWMAAVKYCLELGADVNAADTKGYTALHGVAFRGDNEMIGFLVEKGAKVDGKTKKGDTIADMANGPIAHSIPHPETVALLEKLGSANSHNCRSDQCVPPTLEDKKPAVAVATPASQPAPK